VSQFGTEGVCFMQQVMGPAPLKISDSSGLWTQCYQVSFFLSAVSWRTSKAESTMAQRECTVCNTFDLFGLL